MPMRISASLGSGVLLQEPMCAAGSCRACRSRTAARAHAGSPPAAPSSEPSALAMPSIVVIEAPFGLDGEHGATLHRLAVEIDRAGAAMGGVAADMGAGQIQVLADKVDQHRARLDQSLDLAAVDGQFHLGFCHGFDFLDFGPGQRAARVNARRKARATMTPPTLVRYLNGAARVSAAGDMTAAAALLALAIAATSRPCRSPRLPRPSASTGRSFRLVRLMAQVATCRPPLAVSKRPRRRSHSLQPCASASHRHGHGRPAAPATRSLSRSRRLPMRFGKCRDRSRGP